MAKQVVKKFEAYAIHAHHDTVATYTELFQRLSDLPRSRRVHQMGDLVCGFPIVEADGNRFFIRAVEGDTESSALVLDRDTGGTRDNLLSNSEILSQATHFVVSPQKRRVIIEYVRRGAKASVIAKSIEGILRENIVSLRNVRLEFTPVIREAFISEISTFERIREARLRVSKPNASWSDHYSTLSDFLEDSDGQKADVGVRAERNRTLSKTKGIVGAIKEVIRDAQPYVDEAMITGTRKDESAETTIRATKNVEHTRVRVDTDDAGAAYAEDIKSKLFRYLSNF